MYYSDEVIDEVISRNDIVNVISGYVSLRKKEGHLKPVAHFIMKRHRLLRWIGTSSCITVLDVVPGEMYLHLSWNMRICRFRKQYSIWLIRQE